MLILLPFVSPADDHLPLRILRLSAYSYTKIKCSNTSEAAPDLRTRLSNMKPNFKTILSQTPTVSFTTLEILKLNLYTILF